MVKKPTVKISSRELAYRTEHYHDIRVMKDRQTVCASCGNKTITEAGKVSAHPIMGTLQCEKCWDHFNNIDFSSDEDHLDKYCRLCAHSKSIYICGSASCTFAFCKRCIKRNAPLALVDIEKKTWKCFICEPKPLWELRAVCASVMDTMARKSKSSKTRRDSTLPHKRHQNLQIRKMQKALQSICDEEDDDDECDNNTLMPFFHKSSEKERKSKCQESGGSKKSTAHKLSSTVWSNNSSDDNVPKKESSLKNTKAYNTKKSYQDDSTSDSETKVQQASSFKSAKSQSQRKQHVDSSKNNMNDLSSDESNKMRSSKLSKKSKQKTGTLSCRHTSNSEESEQSEPCPRIKRYHAVVRHDKVNTSKFSNYDKKNVKLDSNSESEEENVETAGRKKVKTLPGRSKKKKYCTKAVSESDKKIIMSPPLIDNDTDSSSGREFQKTKLLRTGYNSLRKKLDKQQIHITSTKRNVISKQKCKHLRSYVMELLDELKQHCSVFELQAYHIEYKCKKRPMYLEDANKIVYKSKSVINKMIVDFSSYEKNLMNFYKSFVSTIKEEHESSEDETVLINRKRHKRKSNESKPMDAIKSEVVSDCDSEIFSGNEAVNSEVAEMEKSNCNKENSSSEKDDERSSNRSFKTANETGNVESVESRVSQTASPILGKPQGRKNLSKPSDNPTRTSNANSESSDVENAENQTCDQDDASENGLKSKEDKSEVPSNKLITAIPSNLDSTMPNDSLTDMFETTVELDNETNMSEGIKSMSTHETDNKIVEEEDDTRATNSPDKPKEDEPSNKKEEDNENVSDMKTQEICESNKSDSDSEKTSSRTESSHKKDTISESVEQTEASEKKNSTELDSAISESQKSADKSDDSFDSQEKNQSDEKEDKSQTDDESDCNATTNLDKNASTEPMLDNIKQNDNEETNLTDMEITEKDEERIKSALLESDSDDSIPSLSPKEMEINEELGNIDYSKTQSVVSENGSTKSDKSDKSEGNGDDTKSFKKHLSRKRHQDLESDSSVGSRVKRRRLHLQKNYYYMNDKKLRMLCQVQMERLEKNILKRYERALQKSKEYQDDKKLDSLVDLDSLERTNKRSSTTSKDKDKLTLKSLKTKPGDIMEEEDSLMDHLKKVQDGNIPVYTEDDSDNNEQNLNPAMNRHSAMLTNDDLMLEADNVVKNLLLNSSDSNLDEDKEQQAVSDNKDEDPPAEKTKTTKRKEVKKESAQSDDEESEEKKEKKRKSKWRRNKVLTMKISDSDSEKEKEKWEKTQMKLKTQEEDSDKNIAKVEKKSTEHKKKKNRRILDSDSDVEEIKTDSESNVSSSTSEVQILSSSDEGNEKKPKKKRPKGSKKSSDSDSSIAESKPKPKRRRIKNVASDSNSDSDKVTNSQGTPNKLGRKNIRKVLKDKQVAADTKQAAKEEEERLKRITERQKLYNEMYETRLAGEEKVEKLVLDFDPDTREELVSVNKDLVKRLKPHQAKGIKFMWDACFESLERIKTTSGSGCIIAHCMGLGKTLQVISLSHTLLTHESTGVKTILVVCPLSTVLNWVNEFNLWLKDIEDGDIDIYELTKCKKNFERKYQLQYWQQHGGVLIIGYEMFRNLTGPNKSIRKNMKEAILQCLIDPGPDLIVCDEGHLLKNEDTALSKCMKRIKTLRRIVLTGTPLQNNLIEYHCMVQFVKPNLLGTKREFLNRFANPITNGQFDNSTEYDVKLMKKRAHVLHKLLQGSVQRFDYSVLTPFLPPKQEYVIFVRLSDVQIKLYQYYLDNLAGRVGGMRGTLFTDFQSLQRIWTHPVVLRLNAEKLEKANEKKRLASDSEGSLRNFVVSDDRETTSTSESDSDVQSVHSSTTTTTVTTSRRKTRSNACDDNSDAESVETVPEKEEWWSQFVESEHFDDLRISAKLVLLFGILEECEKIGDKVLVFSQSLYSLTLIEQFLAQIDEAEQNNTILENLDGHTGSWSLGLDYFRLDGQTSAENRNVWCKIFNRPTNTRARLFLISTRAGGLGINLTAANRVIIFDASWNPSHDIQSIFRVYRFGQKKPCYVYRFLAAGTMEEKIYNRQVTKLSLSCRVVDEQQIERHYSHNALNELYKFEPHTEKERSTLNLPKDRLLAEIFLKYKNHVENYHEHDSLLENKADEELDEEERKQAWLEYEEEKKGIPQSNPSASIHQNLLLQQYNMIANLSRPSLPSMNNAAQLGDYENLQKLIEKDYPHATPEQRKLMTTRALVDMYNYWERQAMLNTNRNAIIAQGMQQNMQQNVQQNMQQHMQPSMKPSMQTNIQQTPASLNAANVSSTNQNLLRQHLLQHPTLIYTPSNANTNVSNPPLKDKVINPYAYPKASTSNVQSRSETPQVTLDLTNTTDTSAKATTVPPRKEKEE